MSNLNIWTAFIAGFLSFFSPCVLPLFAVYISLITGSSVQDLQENKVHRTYILLKILWFVLGFSLVFILLGVFAQYLFAFFFYNKKILHIASGSIIIFFGLTLLDIIKLKFLSKSKKVNFQPSKSTGSFLIGVIFALGWTPCVGPILASILAMASSEETVSKAVIFLSTYSLGLSVPFFITGIFANFFITRLKYINKYLGSIQKVLGILLIILGVLIIYGKIF
ncbi:MAG: cytochrome c biogenesis protein CcdA [bacterium]|nr:cytochrome c biogenesis protein CcdA [bacterium]